MGLGSRLKPNTQEGRTTWAEEYLDRNGEVQGILKVLENVTFLEQELEKEEGEPNHG